MHSLTPEGGNIALMDIVVLQVHPVAYLEFRIDSDGKKHQEGPRNEADEAACKESWRVSSHLIILLVKSDVDCVEKA